MGRWGKILLCVAFSFMFLFVTAGYAMVSETFIVDGTVQYDREMKAVYITDVIISAKSNTTGNGHTVTTTGTLSFIHGDYTLKAQGSGTGGSVSIAVTVKNNSGVDQYFGHHTATSNTDINKLKNTKITYAQTGEARLVKHGETKTFTFTIQNTSRYSTISMKNFESLLVFSPNFDDNMTMNATDALAKAFANVLAGKGPNGDGKGIVYQGRDIAAEDIMGEITRKMTDVDTGGYTGNVGNATQDEKDLIAAIFGDNIIIQIGSNYYSVYILIKNQQIDGKGENDMVIYVTADQLNMGAGEWRNNKWQNLNIVPVYGLVFIKENQGYKYCNHLFAGEAPVCDFGGALGEGKVGNFHTNIWNSTELNVTDNSGGSIGQQYITTNGELDEAYQRYIANYPDSLINPDDLQ